MSEAIQNCNEWESVIGFRAQWLSVWVQALEKFDDSDLKIELDSPHLNRHGFLCGQHSVLRRKGSQVDLGALRQVAERIAQGAHGPLIPSE